MPHIIFGYRKKNPICSFDSNLNLVEYALHVNYIYALVFLLGFFGSILILIREDRRLKKLASKEKEKEKITELRGGSDDAYETDLNLLQNLYTLFYLKLLSSSSPLACIEPGHYEVVDPQIVKILLSIIGNNVVGPSGIYEPMVISPGLLIMASVIKNIQKSKVGKVSGDAAIEVLKATIREDHVKNTLIEPIRLRSILQNWSYPRNVTVSLPLIANIFGRIFVRLSPDLSLAMFLLNIVQLLSVSIGLGLSIGPVLGLEIVMLKALLTASLASTLLLAGTKPLVCNRMLRALPATSTHSEYLMSAPVTAPRDDRVAMKDTIILYARKKDEPQKSLSINFSEQRDMLCESREFEKTLEGKILEASDLKDQVSMPTSIQKECNKDNKDKVPGRSIQVTQKIKTLSDVKQHDERPVREVTVLEIKGILEDGNWYGAEKQLTPFKVNPTKQVPRTPYRKKQTMNIRDLPKDDLKENSFVEEDTQRVSKLAEKAEKISYQNNYDDDFWI